MAEPLAFVLRPTTIADIIGQSHIINDHNGVISRMLKYNFASSLIFSGDPGVGKSIIARALANDLQIDYAIFNAEIDKKQDLENIINQAGAIERFIIIIEEVHRMNKDRQDILLQYLENGHLIMFACTTENPYFVINPVLRSRANIIKLERITPEEMLTGLKKLITNKKLPLTITTDALTLICQLASGDLRIAINILELCLNLYPTEEITPVIVKNIAPSANLINFSAGDEHNDLKSALQKSIRGSDVDAALYYFARLLASGDYEALLRRMQIIAYEDIGLANPAIAGHVKTAIDSFRQIGLPEGRIPLGLAIVEMCLSEKSNSAYLATDQAYEDVLNGKLYPIPHHLRDTSYASAGKLGNGIGYQYPHDFPDDYVSQQYLPKEMCGVVYYHPKLHSVYEKRINELYERFTKKTK
ncbi:replication-associated recombination protein A [Spiroplasma endosymbiont of Polydrusus pterygomalis]|uniref:replication-associated recombination protein A n=1 Tax=Spiroplasma endosymbiont of Polydrusus pterygomalis TaxID=3139327 RepID=UPI003CCA8FBF